MSEAKTIDRLPPRLTNLKITIAVDGVFAIPEEWRKADEDNPNVFQYSIAFLDQVTSKGKIHPREISEKEKKEIEEAELLKKAKKAPPPKKDAKIEVDKLHLIQPPKPNPEEEKAKLLKEQLEQEEAARLQQEWDALTPEEQFYRTSEDPFKQPQLRFPDPVISQQLTPHQLTIQLERFKVDKGEWLIFYKSPLITEEEVIKLRKSKPKTLNLNDLNYVIFKGWIDYSIFETVNLTESIQRIKFTQYLDEQDSPHPNIETMYMKLKVTLSAPFKSERIQPHAKFTEIIAPAPEPLPMPASEQCIIELRNDLQVIIESLAMEYSNMFGKELNQFQDNKVNNMLMTHQKKDLQRRKEHFLYDFNISGKYKILKERIKKSIVKLCRDKFQKSGSVTGISTTQTDQFYSELYVFLMDQMRNVLANLVKENKEVLKEDFSQFLSKKEDDVNNKTLIEAQTGETRVEQLERLCFDYEILNQFEQVEKFYQELLSLNRKDADSLMKFATFCLRTDRLIQAEQLIESSLSYDSFNQNNQLLLTGLYFKRDKIKECRVILELLLEQDPNSLIYTLFLYLIVQDKDKPFAAKLFCNAERIFLRSQYLIPQAGQHFANPQLYEIPWVRVPIPVPDKPEKDKAIIEQKEKERLAFELAHVPIRLTPVQQDTMYLQLIEYFEQATLLDLADRCVQILNDKNHERIQLLSAKIAKFKGDYELSAERLQLILGMKQYNLDDHDDLEVRVQLIEVLYRSIKYSDCEQQIYQILQNPELQDSHHQFSMYLLLGNIFLSQSKFANARVILTKATEIKPQSSLAWLGLGIAGHECGLYKEAQKALKMANIYEPKNDIIWGYIALNCLKDGARFRDANSALREMKKTEPALVDLLGRLAKEFYAIEQYQTSKELLLQALHLAEQQEVLSGQIIRFQIDLANTNEKLGLIDQAIEFFNEAHIRIEDEEMNEYVNKQIERLHFQELIKY